MTEQQTRTGLEHGVPTASATRSMLATRSLRLAYELPAGPQRDGAIRAHFDHFMPVRHSAVCPLGTSIR